MDATVLTPTPTTVPILPSPRHPTAGERHGRETTRIIRRTPSANQ